MFRNRFHIASRSFDKWRISPLVLAAALLSAVAFSPASASDFVVRDTFNLGTANTPLSQRPLEVDTVGGGWVQGIGSDFRITLDGVATHDASLNVEPGIAVVDTLLSEYDLKLQLTRPGTDTSTGSVMGAVFRYMDEANHFKAVHDGRHVKLVRAKNGVESVLDQLPLVTTDDVVAMGAVHVRHDGISITIEGYDLLETEDNSFVGATHAGLIFEAVQTTSFRNFTVMAASDPPGNEPQPEPAPPDVFDTFTAANGQLLDSHTGTETGGSWSSLRGTWQITGGTAVLATPNPALPFADQVAVIPAGGTADQAISADITWHGGTAGVVWDALDTSNYSLVFWDGGYLVAGRVQAGEFREFGRQQVAWSPGETRNLRVRINNDRVRVYLDNSEPVMLGIGLPGPALLNGGIFVKNGLQNRFDNFTVRKSAPISEPEPSLTSDPPFPGESTQAPVEAWFFDSFDSPDATLLEHRSPEVDPSGNGWDAVSGTWQIWEAQASEQSGVFGPTGLDRFAVIDTGVDEYEVESAVQWDGGRAGVLFGARTSGRDDAGRNGFLFFRNGTRLEVGRLIGGVYFRIDQSENFNWNANERRTMRVKVNGDEATLSLGQSEIFSFNDSALRYSTWAGLFQRGRTDERFDNFTVTLPEGTEPPPGPAILPIADVELRAGETLTVPLPVSGPASFISTLEASAERLPDGRTVFDSFSGDSRPLAAHTTGIAPNGSTWVQVQPGSAATVSDGTVQVPISGAGGDQRIVIETGYSDVEVSVEVMPGTSGRAGLVARHDGSTDDADWVMGWVDVESDLAFIGSMLNGQFQLLNYAPFQLPGSRTEMSLRVTGTDAALYVDGAQVLTADVPAGLTGTHSGLFSRSFAGPNRFDDFTVRGLGLPDFISFTGGSDPSLQLEPAHLDGGSYRVVIEGTADDIPVSASFHLAVILPVPPTAEAGGPYTADEGDSVLLDATASTPGDAEITGYAWDVNGDGLTDFTGATNEFVPVRTGEHEVLLTLTDANGLTSESTTTVTVLTSAPAVDLDEMVLLADAVISGSAIQLTPDALWRLGAAWIPAPVEVADGFTATFAFRMDSAAGERADGLAFVVHNSPAGTDALGAPGDGIGYSQIENSLAVEFDTWTNTMFGESGPHIAVHSNGPAANTSSGTARLGSANVDMFPAGDVVYTRIEYQPGTLRVFMNDFTAPVLELSIDIAELLDLHEGSATAGFAAATGGASESHTVLSLNLEPQS